MNKILVPTDFSPPAEQALKVAIRLAKKMNSEIILLNVMLTNDDAIIEANEQGVSITASAEENYLKDVVKGVQTNLKNLIAETDFENISYEIISGGVVKAITKYIESHTIDMIVMGTHGENEDDDYFITSLAERIVRACTCPIVTVQVLGDKQEREEFKNIVFACDLEQNYQIPIDEVKKFQALYNATLHLVFVNTQSSFLSTYEAELKAQSFAANYQLDNYEFHLYCDYVEDEGIVHFAETVDADLVVMVSRKRKGFSRLLSGSVSEGVVRLSKIPVLTFNLGDA